MKIFYTLSILLSFTLIGVAIGYNLLPPPRTIETVKIVEVQDNGDIHIKNESNEKLECPVVICPETNPIITSCLCPVPTICDTTALEAENLNCQADLVSLHDELNGVKQSHKELQYTFDEQMKLCK